MDLSPETVDGLIKLADSHNVILSATSFVSAVVLTYVFISKRIIPIPHITAQLARYEIQLTVTTEKCELLAAQVEKLTLENELHRKENEKELEELRDFMKGSIYHRIKTDNT